MPDSTLARLQHALVVALLELDNADEIRARIASVDPEWAAVLDDRALKVAVRIARKWAVAIPPVPDSSAPE